MMVKKFCSNKYAFNALLARSPFLAAKEGGEREGGDWIELYIQTQSRLTWLNFFSLPSVAVRVGVIIIRLAVLKILHS